MEISCTDRVTNDKGSKGKRNTQNTIEIERRGLLGFVTSSVGTAF